MEEREQLFLFEKQLCPLEGWTGTEVKKEDKPRT